MYMLLKSKYVNKCKEQTNKQTNKQTHTNWEVS